MELCSYCVLRLASAVDYDGDAICDDCADPHPRFCSSCGTDVRQGCSCRARFVVPDPTNGLDE